MCSQIYSHPVEGYKCFANANKSQGTYYTCCDLDTREIKYVTYIYDGYFMGYYLVQSAIKVADNFANCQEKYSCQVHQTNGLTIRVMMMSTPLTDSIRCNIKSHHLMRQSIPILIVYLQQVQVNDATCNSIIIMLFDSISK